MKRALALACCLAALAGGASMAAPGVQEAPRLNYVANADFLKLPPGMNFGETLGVAVNSKGEIVVLHHPGSPTTGPIYGNATSQIWKFKPDGSFDGEIAKNAYGLAYAHSIRFDRYDNLWVVDKATNSVMKINPEGRIVMNLGRRDEGFDSAVDYKRPKPADAVPVDGRFDGPTDVAWDAQDNIYVSDGYVNSRIAKFTKDGDWITSWGGNGKGGVHADENPGLISNPHNMQIDRAGNVYIADRGNRRIQVFDGNGKFEKFLFLNVPYDKSHHPTLDNLPKDVSTRPDETQPWALCITNTPTQYLYAVDAEPGRLYKMTLDGKILGVFGYSGHKVGQFNWPHAIACPAEDVLYIADMNNWRIQKLTLAGKSGGH